MMIRAVVGGWIFAGCCLAAGPEGKPTPDIANDAGTGNSATSTSASETILLAVGKARAIDPAKQQERAIVAVRKVAEAARQFQPAIVAEVLVDPVMTREQFWRGQRKAKVNGAIFRQHLERLAQTATAEDTVIIYTHSHGTEGGLDVSRPPGGMILDPGTHFSWDEYAELILSIPAKNVVVLTMACFSGGLVERFNSPQVRDRWIDRRQKEGRNLIVLTSQNKDLMSPPIVTRGELINPFTYAVSEAFAGQADGFQLVAGKQGNSGRSDGRLTAGELVDFILYTTQHTPSATAQRKNIAQPQFAGSYGREDVLLTRGERAENESSARTQERMDGRR